MLCFTVYWHNFMWVMVLTLQMDLGALFSDTALHFLHSVLQSETQTSIWGSIMSANIWTHKVPAEIIFTCQIPVPLGRKLDAGVVPLAGSGSLLSALLAIVFLSKGVMLYCPPSVLYNSSVVRALSSYPTPDVPYLASSASSTSGSQIYISHFLGECPNHQVKGCMVKGDRRRTLLSYPVEAVLWCRKEFRIHRLKGELAL